MHVLMAQTFPGGSDVHDSGIGGLEALFFQFLPVMVFQALLAWLVYLIATKRGINPWPWTLGTLVPSIGLLVSAVFHSLSLAAAFERLRALEDGSAK